ncbi:F0F1 ATP synthase subunit A [Halomonas shantousis]
MNDSPLVTSALFHIGPVAVSAAVVVTWLLVVGMAMASWALTRGLSLRPGKAQCILELLVETLDHQIRDTMQVPPQRYRALIGTLFLFILAANWSALIPGIEPPTAHLETDVVLALIVLAASIGYGVATRGVAGYLRTFAEPSWVMIPLNLVEQLTRTFSLIVRLFGNIMSGVFVLGITLSLAGLLVPIPFMALDMLTGAIQAYIFSVLAMVFLGAAVEAPPLPHSLDHKEP